MLYRYSVGNRIRGTLGDVDPLNKVPVEESQKRVKKGSLFWSPPYPTKGTWALWDLLPKEGARFPVQFGSRREANAYAWRRGRFNKKRVV